MYINVLNSILSSTPTENNYHCAKNEHPPIKKVKNGAQRGFGDLGRRTFYFQGTREPLKLFSGILGASS